MKICRIISVNFTQNDSVAIYKTYRPVECVRLFMLKIRKVFRPYRCDIIVHDPKYQNYIHKFPRNLVLLLKELVYEKHSTQLSAIDDFYFTFFVKKSSYYHVLGWREIKLDYCFFSPFFLKTWNLVYASWLCISRKLGLIYGCYSTYEWERTRKENVKLKTRKYV